MGARVANTFGMEMKFWVLCLVSVIVSAEDIIDYNTEGGEGSGSGDGPGDGSGNGSTLAFRSLIGPGDGSGDGPGDGSGNGSGDSSTLAFRSLTEKDGSGTNADGEEDYDGSGVSVDPFEDNIPPENSYRSLGLSGTGEGEGTKKKSKLDDLLNKLNHDNGGSDNGGSDNSGSDNSGSDNGGSDNGGLSENSQNTLQKILSDKSGNEREMKKEESRPLQLTRRQSNNLQPTDHHH